MKKNLINSIALASITMTMMVAFQNCSSGASFAQTPQSAQGAANTLTVSSSQTTYSWEAGNWSSCSSTCGTGVITRAVSCIDSNSQPVSSSLCSTST